MKNDILKMSLWVLVCLVVFVNFVFLNVILHEFGHYMAADYYGLKPEMNLDFNSVGKLSFNFEAIPLASTSFIDNGDKNELFAVVLMGPFMNLILSILFLISFVYFKRNFVREFSLIGFVISMGSFLMNILPIAGADGNVLFGLI